MYSRKVTWQQLGFVAGSCESGVNYCANCFHVLKGYKGVCTDRPQMVAFLQYYGVLPLDSEPASTIQVSHAGDTFIAWGALLDDRNLGDKAQIATANDLPSDPAASGLGISEQDSGSGSSFSNINDLGSANFPGDDGDGDSGSMAQNNQVSETTGGSLNQGEEA